MPLHTEVRAEKEDQQHGRRLSKDGPGLLSRFRTEQAGQLHQQGITEGRRTEEGHGKHEEFQPRFEVAARHPGTQERQGAADRAGNEGTSPFGKDEIPHVRRHPGHERQEGEGVAEAAVGKGVENARPDGQREKQDRREDGRRFDPPGLLLLLPEHPDRQVLAEDREDEAGEKQLRHLVIVIRRDAARPAGIAHQAVREEAREHRPVRRPVIDPQETADPLPERLPAADAAR